MECPAASSPICAASVVGTPSRASPTATFMGEPPGSSVAARPGACVMSTRASPTTRTPVDIEGLALEVDGGVRGELAELVVADDLADRPAAGAHDEGVGLAAAGPVAHAPHQLAVGDAGRDEEAVV